MTRILPRAIKQFILRTATTALAAALVAGCASQTIDAGPDATPKIHLEWPEPPNEPKFIFETQLRNITDIRNETDEERLRRLLTGRGISEGEPIYRKPAALAARKGRIYVADAETSAIFVFDVPRGKLFPMGVREPDNVQRPIALALDGQSNVYVLDGSRRRVLVYDALGLFMFAVGNPGSLVKPAGVAVSPDGTRIFVVDRGSVENNDHKVIAYAPDGRELFRIGPRGNVPGALNIPLAATVSADGKLYVLDSGNFRVQAFDLDGKFLSTFGSVGNGFGQFSRPRGLASDPAGNVYVSDASFNNVQIFDPAGNLLLWIGEPGLKNLPGQFGLIGALAVDETGRLYVADQYQRKVEVYRPAKSR